MFYYWYRIIRILIAKNFQKQINIEEVLSRTFTFRLFDCDGLRVMTAFKYAAYMDFICWEMIARSKLYREIVLKGLAPTLGSQKIITPLYLFLFGMILMDSPISITIKSSPTASCPL